MKTENKATPAKLRKRYTRTVKMGDGWNTYLQIDHQGFGVFEARTKAHALWYAKMLSIALARMIEQQGKP